MPFSIIYIIGSVISTPKMKKLSSKRIEKINMMCFFLSKAS